MTFTQLNARLKNISMGWLLVLGLKECLVQCATLCVKSEVMLMHIYSESKRMTITNAHFTTISGHFSANCILIFHKNEVQTVILGCLTGLNLDWFKSYGLRCRMRPRACLAKFQKIAIDLPKLFIFLQNYK